MGMSVPYEHELQRSAALNIVLHKIDKPRLERKPRSLVHTIDLQLLIDIAPVRVHGMKTQALLVRNLLGRLSQSNLPKRYLSPRQ